MKIDSVMKFIPPAVIIITAGVLGSMLIAGVGVPKAWWVFLASITAFYLAYKIFIQ